MSLVRTLKSKLSEGQKRQLKTLFGSYRWPRDILFCYWKGLKWSQSWQFLGLPLLQFTRGSTVKIGRDFKCNSDPRKNTIGLVQPVVLKTNRKDALLSIGNGVGISGSTLSATRCVEIGDRVLIGSGCIIADSDAHPIEAKDRHDASKIASAPIRIGDDCFIGARSIITKGVTIGARSVIGAGSVVSRDVPSDCIAAGNPAKVIKALKSEQQTA